MLFSSHVPPPFFLILLYHSTEILSILGEGKFPCFTQIFVENVAISFQIQWILDDLYETKIFLKNFKKAIDKQKVVWYNKQVAARERQKWKHSSVGRASALQAEGHRFEPYCFHQVAR